jgi:predicted ATPase
LAQCQQLLRTAFQQQHGSEVDTQGDAFFVAFARATDAVSAAITAQRALASHAWPAGVAVHVRMGLHTGEPERSAEGYVGLDVHYAARIMSAGHGGQVLLSEATRHLVAHELPEGVSLRDVGKHRLKDVERPTHLFQLVIAGLAADFPALRTLDNAPCHLPAQLTPFIGREREGAAACSLLLRQDVRLVTLTGPGGVGKTRMALQVAEQLCQHFVDGVFFVSLAPLRDPALVLPTLAQTLTIREVAGQPLPERLVEELRGKQMLLLLDNFEQIMGAAPQIADLLAACPQLKVLITSREVLRVQAEHEFVVPPLTLPDAKRLPDLDALSHSEAVALFLQRAEVVKPGFHLTETTASAIAEICIRLDGLPLAIELAAARMKLLSPQALLARLGQRLAVLTGGTRNAPTRQQTLRNTIAWSYDLLEAEEQKVFRSLSVFAGGCVLSAAESVCTAESDEPLSVLDTLASLLDKSLLQRGEQDGEEPRFTMLETLREYGLEALAESGEAQSVRQAHAMYYLAWLETEGPKLEGSQESRWFERLEQEQDNLRAAMKWALAQGESGGDMELALRLGVAMRALWSVRGNYSEMRAFLEQALARDKGSPTAVRAKALRAAARLAEVQGDISQAQAFSEESLTLFRQIGDQTGIALALHALADIVWVKGDLATARTQGEESLALFRELGDEDDMAELLLHLATLSIDQGEYERARALLEEGLQVYRRLRSQSGIADSLLSLARVHLLAQGDLATVRSLLEESFSLFSELGDKESTAYCYSIWGMIAFYEGELALARQMFEQSLALFREMQHQHGTTEMLAALARVAMRQSDYATARHFFEESLALARQAGDKLSMAADLEGIAEVVAAQGQPIWATRLWGAAAALREALGAPVPLIDRSAYQAAVESARTQLCPDRFDAAWAEGRRMTLEQVLASQEQGQDGVV